MSDRLSISAKIILFFEVFFDYVAIIGIAFREHLITSHGIRFRGYGYFYDIRKIVGGFYKMLLMLHSHYIKKTFLALLCLSMNMKLDWVE